MNTLNNDFEEKLFKFKNAYIKFTDENNIDIKIRRNCYSMDSSFEGITKEIYDYRESVEFNYNFIQKNQNFIIHPNESVYFEYFIVLPYGNYLEGNANWIEIDSNKKYFAEIFMNSDSTNYKKTISRVDLQTIKENGYEVYNGVIKSKNKIPIKFVALPK